MWGTVVFAVAGGAVWGPRPKELGSGEGNFLVERGDPQGNSALFGFTQYMGREP